MVTFTVLLLSFIVPPLLACKPNEICPITLTTKQNKQFQLELVSMLGLPDKPNKAASKQLKYSSKFLLNLYNTINTENRETNRIKRNINLQQGLREDEVNKADLSDVIVSLNSVNKKSDGVGKRQRLSFFMKNLPQTTGIFGAELKLYQNSKIAQNLSYSMYTISVYKAVFGNDTQMKKMAEKVTSAENTGWLSIDISYIFNAWLEDIDTNKDLFVSVQPFGVEDEKEIHPAQIGIVFQHKQIENEPFIVAFLEAENRVKPRISRDTMLQHRGLDLITLWEKDLGCGIHSLRVSFKDLGWSDWVIAPEGYTSAFCQGNCNFPMRFPTRPTNHAIIQSLVQIKHPKKFPKPSCAPTKLNSLSVLYRERENTILKKYKNMIAASCGCQ